MHGARRELLAGAGGTDDQDAAVGGRDLLDGLAQEIDRGRMPDQCRRCELLEHLDLAPEARVLERALRHQHEAVRLERLLDEVVGTLLDGRDRGLDIAVAGDHHHRQLGMLLLDGVEELEAVEPAALQPDVEKHEIGAPRPDLRERIVTFARGACDKALVLQDSGDQFADVGLVVDDQNIECHDLVPCQLNASPPLFFVPARSQPAPPQIAAASRRLADLECARPRRATRSCPRAPQGCGPRSRARARSLSRVL